MRIKYKEDILRMLAVYTSIFLFIAICKLSLHGEAAIVCPNVSIKYGSSRAISCESDLAISDFYWYRGNSTSTPILLLDNEGKAGIEYGSEHFDISSNGSMILKDVLLEHESYYSFVGYYENGKFGKAVFLVNVTMIPSQPCPTIHGCNSCIECDFSELKEKGTFTCEIKGARPMLPLSWNITSQNGVNFVEKHHKEQRHAENDSWDTSISLDYTIKNPCEVSAEVTCQAEDRLQILRRVATTVKIRKGDQCNDVTAISNGNFATKKNPAIPAIIVPTVVILVVFVSYVVYKLTRRPPSVHQLVWSLKDRNQKFCHLKPLQWVEDINIADLYVESQCTVKDKTMSTQDLKTADFFTKRWVYFIADHGYGRTTFLKKVVQEWIKDDKNMLLIVYISLKEVRKSDTLSQIIVGDKPKASRFQTEDIESILKTEECLVILDGFEDLRETFEEFKDYDRDDREDEERDHPVTIGQLLQGKASRCYTRLHVWVSLREADCKNLPSPQDKMEVKLTGFSNEQFSRYMHSCCHYYFSLKNNKKSTGQSGSTNGCNISCNLVEKFLQENEIRTKFEETPLLTNLMLHILAAKFTSAISLLEDKAITDMYTLMCVVIDSMEARYIHKMSLSKTSDFSKLKAKLGKFALRHKGQLADIKRSTWEHELGKDSVNTALEIGLLKMSKDTDSAATDSVIEFYHQQIEDYLAKQVQNDGTEIM